MKPERLLQSALLLGLVCAVLLPPPSLAQEIRVATNSVAAATPQWRVKSRLTNATEWYSVRRITNVATRRVREVTNSYVELASGLNVRDSRGRWQPATPAFTITTNGAEALGTVHRVRLAPDIGTLGSFTVRKGGTTLQGHPLCVAYFDPVDGRVVRLAAITNAIGWLVGSNASEVVYSNCFNGFGLRASIRYRNSRSGIAQDLLIHQPPAFTPEEMGLSSRAHLELITELVGDTPTPQVSDRVLQPERDPAVRAQMREPDLIDSTLTFGAFRMAEGAAFNVGGTNRGSRWNGERVAKRYEIIEGRRVLIEGLPHRRIRSMLDRLPQAALPGVRTNVAFGLPQSPAAVMASAFKPSATRRLPPALVNSIGDARIQTAAAAPGARSVPERSASIHPGVPGQPDRLASLADAADGDRPRAAENSSKQGSITFVLDFELLDLSEGYDAFTFQADTTYRCSGPVNLGIWGGAVTFMDGTVVKYDEDIEGYVGLQIFGPIVCKTEPHRPAVFTSVFDGSVGQVISTAASPGRYFNTMAFGTYGNQLRHLRISYAQYGIHAYEINLRHAQFTQCDVPLHPEGNCQADNLLLADVGCAVGGSFYTVAASHWTVHNCPTLLTADWGPEYCSARFTNSIFVNIDGMGEVADYGFDHCTEIPPNAASPFQSAGGGSRYLIETSDLRDAGTASLDAGLLAELSQRTTRPPDVRTGALIVPTTLAPRGLADRDGLLDLGYHYPVVDWLLNALSVNSTTLTITGGAVVAVGDDGVQLNAATLNSEGKPARLNQFVPAIAVQEAPLSSNPFGATPMISDYPVGFNLPNTRLRFTSFSSLGGAGHFLAWSLFADAFEASHCQFHAGRIVCSYYGNQGRSLGWTNNLFEQMRIELTCWQPATFFFYNNLFRHGSLSLTKDYASYWFIRDNVFDQCSLTDNGPPTANAHNAYIGGVPVLGDSDGGDKILVSLPYESGPWGNYYLPLTVGGQPNPLINGGSLTAAAAGLIHFVTTADQTKEAMSQVDVGVHYVALPLDGDGDGIPDYQEATGGTSASDPDTDGDGVPDGLEFLLGSNPLVADWVLNNGSIHLEAFAPKR